MGLLPPLTAELTANITEFSAKMKEAQAEAKETSEKSGSSFQGLAGAGKIALAAVGTSAVAIGAESIHLAENFQSATASVAGSANISVGAAKSIGDAFLQTGFHSTFSAQQMMAAYAGVAGQLGTLQGKALTAAQASKVMSAATDLAEASGTDLGSSLSNLTTTMQAYHLTLSGAAIAAGDLFNAGRLTGLGVDTVSAALDKLGAKLGAAAPPLSSTAALLVEFAEQGVTGRAAISALNTGLTSLVQPTKAGQKALQSLGVTAAVTAAQQGDVESSIAILSKRFATMTPLQQQQAAAAIFGTSAWKQMLPVIQAGGAAFEKAQSQIDKESTVSRAASLQAHTLHGELHTMEAGVQNLGVQLGTALIPMVTKFIGVASNAVGWLEKHKAVAIVLAAVVGGVLVTAIGAYVAHLAVAGAQSIRSFAEMVGGWFGVGTATEGAAASVESSAVAIGAAEEGMGVEAAAAGAAIDVGLGPIGLALAGVTLAITLLHGHWRQIWTDIKHWVEDAVNFVRQHLALFAAIFAPILLPVIEIARHWKTIWHDISEAPRLAIDFIRHHLALLAEILGGPIGWGVALVTHWKSIWHDVSRAPGEAIDLVKHHMALLGEIAAGPIGWGVAIKQHWKGIWDHLPEPVQHALESIKPAVSGIISFVGRMPSDLGRIGERVLDSVGSFLEKLPERMAYWAGYAAGRFIRELMDLPGQIVHIGETVVGKVVNWGGDLLSAGGHAASSLISGIVGFLTQLPGDIVSILGTVLSAMANWIPQALAWAARLGSQVVSTVVSFFLSLPGRVLSALGSMISALIGFVPKVADAGGHIGKGILDGIMNFVKQIPGELLSVITNIPKMLENAVGSIASGALHIGSGLLHGFLDGIGKHSPSALERAMDEVLAGLQGKMGPLTGIVGQINGLAARPATTGAVAPAGVAPAGALAAVGAGAGAPVINVTVQGHVLTPSGLAQSIVSELRSVLSGTIGRGVAGPVVTSGSRH